MSNDVQKDISKIALSSLLDMLKLELLSESPYISPCPMSMTGMIDFGECDDCPIKENTGKDNCMGTPLQIGDGYVSREFIMEEISYLLMIERKHEVDANLEAQEDDDDELTGDPND
jgi:hypothetical protein